MISYSISYFLCTQPTCFENSGILGLKFYFKVT